MSNDVQRAGPMTGTERRATAALAGIYAVRMLGLFLIFPVFSLYADQLQGATPLLVGLALGVYGFTQGLLQIPFGFLSDRLGRKPVIFAGLILFALGSVVAALADSIAVMILGRALQGAGAIAAAVMALTADLTREEQRTKAMAVIGMSIGVAFTLALVSGPILSTWLRLEGLFWLTAALAVGAMALLGFGVPRPALSVVHRNAEPVAGQFRRVLSDTRLLRLDASIFLLHMMLTASFLVLPLLLSRQVGLALEHHWWVYLPVLMGSVLAMIPMIIASERYRRLRWVFPGAVILLGLSQWGLTTPFLSVWPVAGLLWLFFTGFNYLEATLPSLISKLAPVDGKGTAMGVYSTSQFFGAALGGVLGGWLYGRYGYAGVLGFGALASVVWLGLVAGMPEPRPLRSLYRRVEAMDSPTARLLTMELCRLPGVVEAVVLPDERLAYVKVDKERIDQQALDDLLAGAGSRT